MVLTISFFCRVRKSSIFFAVVFFPRGLIVAYNREENWREGKSKREIKLLGGKERYGKRERVCVRFIRRERERVCVRFKRKERERRKERDKDSKQCCSFINHMLPLTVITVTKGSILRSLRPHLPTF